MIAAICVTGWPRITSDHHFKNSRRSRARRRPRLHKKSIFCTKSSPLMGLYVQSPHKGEGSTPGKRRRRTSSKKKGAVEKEAARRVYPVMAPADYQGHSAGAPVKGPRGLIVSIAECEPGNGPGLHRHLNTVENAVCTSELGRMFCSDEGACVRFGKRRTGFRRSRWHRCRTSVSAQRWVTR